MPFKWNRETLQAETTEMLAALDDQPLPPPPLSNSLSITVTMGDKVLFDSTAPTEMPYEPQVIMALIGLVTGGQVDDVTDLISTLIDYSRPTETLSILASVVLLHTQMMNGLMEANEAMAKLAGQEYQRPHFAVGNFPPPNRPRLYQDGTYIGPDEKEGTDEHEAPPDARPGAGSAGPDASEAGG